MVGRGIGSFGKERGDAIEPSPRKSQKQAFGLHLVPMSS